MLPILRSTTAGGMDKGAKYLINAEMAPKNFIPLVVECFEM